MTSIARNMNVIRRILTSVDICEHDRVNSAITNCNEDTNQENSDLCLKSKTGSAALLKPSTTDRNDVRDTEATVSMRD